MPGFSFFYNTTTHSKNDPKLICDELKGSGFQLKRFTLNKFLDDKLFFEDEKKIIVIEGVILNKYQLIQKSGITSWAEVVWNLYREGGDAFFKRFKGSFSGLLYDKTQAKWILFTDHLGTKALYYYRNDQVLVVSSSIQEIYKYFKEQNLPTQLHTNAAFMLLSYGYMLEDNTLCESIKKLLPGHYMVVQNNGFKLHQYYQLPQSMISKKYDEEEIIEELDYQFKLAIEAEFEKDKEYQYKHFVSLSGGLDSRMVSWVAHEMGYRDQINFTFSQSDYLDETIPKKIAADLKHEWLFKALDNGLFLKDIDKMSLLTGGNVLYYGLAHSYSLYKLIDFSNLGIIHTGQLGDAVIGTIVKNYSEDSLHKLGYAYSDTCVDYVKTKAVHFSDFPELEISALYQRGINGANNGLLSEQDFSETMSPFYDVDFFSYCLSIPLNARMRHQIYKKWILKKHPGAAAYIWESSKMKINQRTIYLRIGNKRIPFHQLPASFLRKVGLKRKPGQTKQNMNPLDYWYITNADIRSFQDKYFAENIHRIEAFPELQKVSTQLYHQGDAVEKNQVLTLLSAVKLFF